MRDETDEKLALAKPHGGHVNVTRHDAQSICAGVSKSRVELAKSG